MKIKKLVQCPEPNASWYKVVFTGTYKGVPYEMQSYQSIHDTNLTKQLGLTAGELLDLKIASHINIH